MRKVLSIFVLSAVSLVLDSCGNNPRASLRIVHAAPGTTSPTPSIDVTIDGNKVLSNVAYSTGSNYFSVTPGPRHFQINVANIDTMINLADKTFTTMTLVGEIGSNSPIPPSIVTSTDDHGAPASGQVKIRVMQALVGYQSPTASPLPVDVYITTFGTFLNGTHPTLANVSYQSTTAYVTMAVGDLEVRVVAPAGCGDPIINPNCNPDNNLLIDSGKVTFTDKKQLRTYVLSDQAPPSAQFQGFFLSDLN